MTTTAQAPASTPPKGMSEKVVYNPSTRSYTHILTVPKGQIAEGLKYANTPTPQNKPSPGSSSPAPPPVTPGSAGDIVLKARAESKTSQEFIKNAQALANAEIQKQQKSREQRAEVQFQAHGAIKNVQNQQEAGQAIKSPVYPIGPNFGQIKVNLQQPTIVPKLESRENYFNEILNKKDLQASKGKEYTGQLGGLEERRDLFLKSLSQQGANAGDIAGVIGTSYLFDVAKFGQDVVKNPVEVGKGMILGWPGFIEQGIEKVTTGNPTVISDIASSYTIGEGLKAVFKPVVTDIKLKGYEIKETMQTEDFRNTIGLERSPDFTVQKGEAHKFFTPQFQGQSDIMGLPEAPAIFQRPTQLNLKGLPVEPKAEPIQAEPVFKTGEHPAGTWYYDIEYGQWRPTSPGGGKRIESIMDHQLGKGINPLGQRDLTQFNINPQTLKGYDLGTASPAKSFDLAQLNKQYNSLDVSQLAKNRAIQEIINPADIPFRQEQNIKGGFDPNRFGFLARENQGTIIPKPISPTIQTDFITSQKTDLINTLQKKPSLLKAIDQEITPKGPTIAKGGGVTFGQILETVDYEKPKEVTKIKAESSTITEEKIKPIHLTKETASAIADTYLKNDYYNKMRSPISEEPKSVYEAQDKINKLISRPFESVGIGDMGQIQSGPMASLGDLSGRQKKYRIIEEPGYIVRNNKITLSLPPESVQAIDIKADQITGRKESFKPIILQTQSMEVKQEKDLKPPVDISMLAMKLETIKTLIKEPDIIQGKKQKTYTPQTPSQITIQEPITTPINPPINPPPQTKPKPFKIPSPTEPKGPQKSFFAPLTKNKQTRSVGGFKVMVRQRGKFRLLGSFGDIGMAFGAGETSILGSAKASFKVIGNTKEIEAKAKGLNPRLFYQSKKEPMTFIQRRETRISSPGEKREIPGKAKMINIFRKR